MARNVAAFLYAPVLAPSAASVLPAAAPSLPKIKLFPPPRALETTKIATTATAEHGRYRERATNSSQEATPSVRSAQMQPSPTLHNVGRRRV